MAYTIHVVALECLKSEEVDGDEIYLKCNGAKFWECAPDKMCAVVDHADFVNHYDFVERRKHTGQGWVALPPSFTPASVSVRVASGGATVQLWEADLLSDDDLLGQTPIDETQASGGNISVVFQRHGAHYRLTYRVEA